MPVMDGWQFLAERNHDPVLSSIPVIVVSGQRDVISRVESAHASYLPKPIATDRLLESIQHIVH
jgi:CheY-like chemotaxis protein